jgi:hypothetical protein
MDKIVEKLDSINKTLEGILKTMRKPESKVMLAFQYGSGAVGILGIFAIIDIIVSMDFRRKLICLYSWLLP